MSAGEQRDLGPILLTLLFGFQVRPQIPAGSAAMASPAVSPDSSSHEALSSVNSAPACSPTSDSENLSPDELELLAKLEEQNRRVLVFFLSFLWVFGFFLAEICLKIKWRYV